ncbi:MAG: NADH-quinone oxidoreductase subunit NuoH [Anaerolineales bacterium]|nr:NADH-quinone oxidoreductase subunit NuoH [Anaerolineales bacterium]
MDWGLLIEWIIKSIVIIVVLLAGFAYLTLLERRLLAKFQVRIGPNRAGPQGILQPVADGIKLIFKEELVPDEVDKVLYHLSPVIMVVPTLIILAVAPFGPTMNLFGREITFGLAPDVNVGVLYLMAVSSIAVYGVIVAGWSSHSKYPLLGGIRASAQMVSYELSLGLSFLGPVLIAGSLSMQAITEAQQTLPFILLQPLGFIIFWLAGSAEINRAPFELMEAEQELTGGYHTEYSGMKFAMFFMAEYVKIIVLAVIGTVLFLGGYWGPFVSQVPILGPIYFAIKVVMIIVMLIWIRASYPRIRYDHLMSVGWKVLMPLALLNIVVTAVVIVAVGG